MTVPPAISLPAGIFQKRGALRPSVMHPDTEMALLLDLASMEMRAPLASLSHGLRSFDVALSAIQVPTRGGS